MQGRIKANVSVNGRLLPELFVILPGGLLRLMKYGFMMKLQTPVADVKCKTGISYSDKIMMLGSCFTDSIGELLGSYGFDVCRNPFGTLYNPLSIAASVERLVSGRSFTSEDVVQLGAGSGLFCSFSHGTLSARSTAEEFLHDANERLAGASAFFRSCNKVIITLGTAWCYRHMERDMVVSNCLKRDAREFERQLCPVGLVVEVLEGIMGMCPDKKFIFTVSPIRHFRDGAHANQISKSTLLLGVEQILVDFPQADYFPSYEIMNDELRDYRFYAEDMCHPSQQAVGYICERFLDWALPECEHSRLTENIRNWKASRHRPLH